MRTKNNYINSKTLEQELKHDKTVEREMGDTEDSLFIMEFMEKVERMRKERQKDSNGYTQKKLAEKAGIGLSTYREYLAGFSDNIKLKTVRKFAHVLRCRISDLVDEEH